jgi:hypothetical protein
VRTGSGGILGICLAASSLLVACGSAADQTAAVERSTDARRETSTTTSTAPPATAAPVVPASAAPTTVPPTTAAPTTTTTTTVAPTPRVVVETGFSPFAVVADVVLHHPASPTERIGFHQSGHDGALQMQAQATATHPFVMESRDRDTTDSGAADIVVDPGAELRAPVTGTVIRGGTYTLYCDHVDEYLVIEPDGHPGWEVKLLHFEGLQVGKGQRVQAGVTRVASHARVLPFESQVDDFTAKPSWPHVHVELVDTSIPDRPTPGAGCS